MRPSFACCRRLSRFTKGTHFTQYDEPIVTAAPQIGQRGFVLGIAAAFTTKLPAFALLRLACVSLVGRQVIGDLFGLPCQKILAASSAYGETAFRHVAAVSESCAANEPIRRQFPFACSKNHSLRSGPRFIQSITYASTRGLTGSMRSHARLSRFGASLCNTPNPGSSPSSAAARRASDSRTA